MTTTRFFPSFLTFLLFGLYIWTIGGAAFPGSPGPEGLLRLPSLGYALLLSLLQITHLVWPIDRPFSTGFLFLTSGVAISIHLSRARHGRALRDIAKAWPKHTNGFGLLYYAPVEGNQSFDSTLPCSNKNLYDIRLLDPAAGIAGGFRPIKRERNAGTRNGIE